MYIAEEWSGEPEDKGEGELKRFKIDKIRLNKMWDDDKYWLPKALKSARVHKRFYFNNNNKIIKQIELKN